MRAGLFFALATAAFAASNPVPRAPYSLVNAPELAASYKAYSLKLGSLATPRSAGGLLLSARINHGPALRLLLDSGSQFIVLNKRAAAKSGPFAGVELDLVGVGAAPNVARMAKALTVKVGDLEFRNCDLIIVDANLMDGIDGVIPLSLFADFLVRLDIPKKTLELSPYGPGSSAADRSFSRARVSGNLIFVKAALNDSQEEGYVLLDTGALYSALSERAARGLKIPPGLASSIPLQGGAGATEGRMLSSGVRFRMGSKMLGTNQVVIVDLNQIEQHHRMEVSGILGYPALRDSVVTVDYRNELIRIGGE